MATLIGWDGGPDGILIGSSRIPGGPRGDGTVDVAGTVVRPITLRGREDVLALLSHPGPADDQSARQDRISQVAALVAGALPISEDPHAQAAVQAVALALAGASADGSLARTSVLARRLLGAHGPQTIGALAADHLVGALAADHLVGTPSVATDGDPRPAHDGWTTIRYDGAVPTAIPAAGDDPALTVDEVRDRLAAQLLDRLDSPLEPDARRSELGTDTDTDAAKWPNNPPRAPGVSPTRWSNPDSPSAVAAGSTRGADRWDVAATPAVDGRDRSTADDPGTSAWPTARRPSGPQHHAGPPATPAAAEHPGPPGWGLLTDPVSGAPRGGTDWPPTHSAPGLSPRTGGTLDASPRDQPDAARRSGRDPDWRVRTARTQRPPTVGPTRVADDTGPDWPAAFDVQPRPTRARAQPATTWPTGPDHGPWSTRWTPRPSAIPQPDRSPDHPSAVSAGHPPAGADGTAAALHHAADLRGVPR